MNNNLSENVSFWQYFGYSSIKFIYKFMILNHNFVKESTMSLNIDTNKFNNTLAVHRCFTTNKYMNNYLNQNNLTLTAYEPYQK